MKSNIIRILLLSILTFIYSCSGNGKKQKIVEKGSPLPTGFYHITHMETDFERELLREPGGTYNIVPRPIVTVANLDSMTMGKDELDGMDVVVLQFNEEGTKAISETTQKVGTQIAFVVNDELFLVAMIQGHITTGEISLLGFSPEQAEKIKNGIK